MFAILVPVCIAPAVIVLFWGDYRAKKLGGKFSPWPVRLY
jgi:hypothetical protein